MPQPPATDKEAWRQVVQASDAMFEPMVGQWLKTVPASVETRTVAGVTVHVATPHTNAHPERAHLRIHGGAWALMGGKFSMGEAAMTAAQFGQLGDLAPVQLRQIGMQPWRRGWRCFDHGLELRTPGLQRVQAFAQRVALVTTSGRIDEIVQAPVDLIQFSSSCHSLSQAADRPR